MHITQDCAWILINLIIKFNIIILLSNIKNVLASLKQQSDENMNMKKSHFNSQFLCAEFINKYHISK